MEITLEQAINHVVEEMERPENKGFEQEIKEWAINDLKDNGCDNATLELIEQFV